MRWFVSSVFLVLLAYTSLPSQAGTFLDRIKERVQERRAAQASTEPARTEAVDAFIQSLTTPTSSKP
jgi:hypothetical protein